MYSSCRDWSVQHRQLAGQTRNGVESTPVAGRLLGASALAPFTCHAARPAVVRPLGKPPQQGASAQQLIHISCALASTPASRMVPDSGMLVASISTKVFRPIVGRPRQRCTQNTIIFRGCFVVLHTSFNRIGSFNAHATVSDTTNITFRSFWGCFCFQGLS